VSKVWKEERGKGKKKRKGKRQRSCDLQILVQTAYIRDSYFLKISNTTSAPQSVSQTRRSRLDYNQTCLLFRRFVYANVVFLLILQSTCDERDQCLGKRYSRAKMGFSSRLYSSKAQTHKKSERVLVGENGGRNKRERTGQINNT